MDFVLHDEFNPTYDPLTDAQAEVVDAAIRELLRDPGARWARVGRRKADPASQWNGAWKAKFDVLGETFWLEWDFTDENKDEIVLFVVYADS